MTGRGFGRALFSSPGGRSPPPLSPKDTPAAPFPGQIVPPGPRVPQNSGSAGSAPCPEEVFSFLVFLYRLRRQRAPLLAPRPAGRSVPPPFPRLLRPCAASSCRKKNGVLMAFPRCSRSSFPPPAGTRPRPFPAARPHLAFSFHALHKIMALSVPRLSREPDRNAVILVFPSRTTPLPEVSPPPSPCPGHAPSSVKKF